MKRIEETINEMYPLTGVCNSIDFEAMLQRKAAFEGYKLALEDSKHAIGHLINQLGWVSHRLTSMCDKYENKEEVWDSVMKSHRDTIHESDIIIEKYKDLCAYY